MKEPPEGLTVPGGFCLWVSARELTGSTLRALRIMTGGGDQLRQGGHFSFQR